MKLFVFSGAVLVNKKNGYFLEGRTGNASTRNGGGLGIPVFLSIKRNLRFSNARLKIN